MHTVLNLNTHWYTCTHCTVQYETAAVLLMIIFQLYKYLHIQANALYLWEHELLARRKYIILEHPPASFDVLRRALHLGILLHGHMLQIFDGLHIQKVVYI
jgi:hypothetical protein